MTEKPDDLSSWVPEREHGLRRLQLFAPKAGSAYSKLRNYDLGSGKHQYVSTLSPWIRHRLILEEEVVSAILARHSFTAATKFIQEIFWRTYWKGWLELRPSVWHNYRRRLVLLIAELEQNSNLRRRWEEAKSGTTGISCFDAWSEELTKTGYLHNHARMWFAGIWIFTLNLPWELGADFFLRHLLDGDPASNTLSWRWVAGMHTRGKTYLARPDNIAKFTANRFRPTSQLSTVARPLPGSNPPAPLKPPSGGTWDCALPTGLLITEEDLHPDFALRDTPGLKGAVIIRTTERRSALEISPKVLEFVNGALVDTRSRLRRDIQCASEIVECTDAIKYVVEWSRHNGLRQLITPYVPVGPTAEVVHTLTEKLSHHDIRLISILRYWDQASWPHATGGFFRFREKIPKILGQVSSTSAA